MNKQAAPNTRRPNRRYDSTLTIPTPRQQEFARIILRILRRILRCPVESNRAIMLYSSRCLAPFHPHTSFTAEVIV
jgi:hypothetical protein